MNYDVRCFKYQYIVPNEQVLTSFTYKDLYDGLIKYPTYLCWSILQYSSH